VLGGDPKGKNFLYTNGNSVIIRDIEVRLYILFVVNKQLINFYFVYFFVKNPAISDVYTEHSCAVNVAKYSPSGFYIASGGMRSNKIKQIKYSTNIIK
jgi:WD repeat-containing protein 1 (actin-interacting protein 1)